MKYQKPHFVPLGQAGAIAQGNCRYGSLANTGGGNNCDTGGIAGNNCLAGNLAGINCNGGSNTIVGSIPTQ